MKRGDGKTLAYVAQIYAAAAMVIALPQCRALLGPKEFGLLMVLLAVQSWLQVADLGFPAALARDLARKNVKAGQAVPYQGAGRLYTPLVTVALGMAATVAYVAWRIAATNGSAEPGTSEIDLPLWAAAATVPLRWIAECLRTVLYGAEAFGQNAWVILWSSTLRIVIGVFLLKFTDSGLFGWMLWQGIVSAVEVLALLSIWRKVIGFDHFGVHLRARDSFRKHWPIARGIAAASLAWMAITQLDKIVLAKALSLQDYGTVAIAAAIPAGLITIAVPIMQLAQPSLVRLHAGGEPAELVNAYMALTRMVCACVFPSAIVCFFFTDQILSVWFRNAPNIDLEQVSRLIPLYSVGATALVLGAIPYSLANATGALRGTMISSSVLAIAILIGLIMGANFGGAYLAVTLWTFTVIIYLIIWPNLIHVKELKGAVMTWNLQLFRSCAPLLLIAGAAHSLVPWDTRPALKMIALCGIWLVLQFAAFATAAPKLGNRLVNWKSVEIARWLRGMKRP